MKTQYLFLIPIFFLSFLFTTDAQNKNKDFKIVTGTVADSNFKLIERGFIKSNQNLISILFLLTQKITDF